MQSKLSYKKQLKRRRSKLFLSRRFRTDLFFTALHAKLPSSDLTLENFSSNSSSKLGWFSTRLIRKFNSVDKEVFFPFYRKLTPYGKRLFEKQRLRAVYGEFKERWFKKSITKFGLKTFLSKLETRLDIFLYRTNLFRSLSEVRQAVQHGNILVNGVVVRKSKFFLPLNSEISFIPSFYLKLLKTSFLFNLVFKKSYQIELTNKDNNLNTTAGGRKVPLVFFLGRYAEYSPTLGKFVLYRYPTTNEVLKLIHFSINFRKILNYYSHSVRF